MKTFLWILATILLLPILLTIVVLAVITLIGGYVALVLPLVWWLIVIIAGIAIGIAIIKKFF